MIEYDPMITCRRAERLLREAIEPAIFTDAVPLEVGVYQCADPIPYATAVRQTFAPVTLGFSWGPLWSTAWFRLRGRVPAAFAEGEFRLLFDTRTEALCWWEGVPFQGVELHRRDIKLPGSVRAGGELEVFVEAACNHMLGVGSRWGDTERMGEFPLTQSGVLRFAHVARYHADRAALAAELGVLIDLTKSLPVSSTRGKHLHDALRRACNAIVPGDPDASVAGARPVIAESLKSPDVGTANTAYCVGNAHIDLAWLWPVRETKRKALRTFSTVLRYMERYPEYRYVQSQAQVYEWVRQTQPAVFEQIRQRIKEGRWEAGGGMWVEMDCNVPSGESIVRQILLGTRYFEQHFGARQRYMWLPDTFGYSAALPQIIKLAGLDAFVTQKISWNQFNKFPFHTFNWVGIDGTAVLSHFLPTDTYIGTNRPNELVHGETNYKQSAKCPVWLNAYGYGDGGGGPTEIHIQRVGLMDHCDGVPRMRHGRVDEFIDEALKYQKDLPQWIGDLYLEIHRGTYTTQARNKRFNRLCEQILHDVEVAQSLGSQTPEERAEMDRLWKLFLLNQFHDILPGSSIGWVYKDSLAEYEAILRSAGDMLGTAVRRIGERLDARSRQSSLVVLNTSGRSRAGVIELPTEFSGKAIQVGDGPAVEVQAVQDLDGRQYRIARIEEVPTLSAVAAGEAKSAGTAAGGIAGELTLENACLAVRLDDAGRIVSLVDKTTGREVLRPNEPANQLVLYEDLPVDNDAWDIDLFYLEQGTPLSDKAQHRIVERGPVRWSIEFSRPCGRRSRIVQRVSLTAGLPVLEFDTQVDWKEDNRFLRVLHPVNVHADHATYEIQFGHLRRTNHFNRSWDYAQFEVPAQRWMDLSEPDFGVTMVNDCKYGHSCHGHVMGLSLLRSPKAPDPEADMAVHRFRYGLAPHGAFDAAQAVAAAEDFNLPLRAVDVGATAGNSARLQLARLEGPYAQGVVLDTVKRAEDNPNELILRLYECRGGRGKVTLVFDKPIPQAQEADLLERPIQTLVKNSKTLELEFRPFQIRTVRLAATSGE